jgi:peptide/nickel transport system substrate-binding protein
MFRRCEPITVLLALALLIVGCAPASQRGDADTLTLSITVPVDSLDPTVAYQTGSFSVMANVFQTLLTLDPKGAIKPGLATDYTLDPVGHTLRFQLDPQANFSNGNPVTSADVKFSVDYWKKGTVYNTYYSSIRDVATPDPHTVVFNMDSTGVALLGVLAIGTASIIPNNFADLPPQDFFRKPIGSGPYAIESAQFSQELSLSVNPHYRDASKLSFKKVRFKVIPDPNQRLVQFQSGTIDIVGEISPAESLQYPQESLKTAPSYFQDMLIANVRNNAVASPQLRKAISLAIDRKALVDSVFKGLAEVGISVQSPTVKNVAECLTCDWGRHDVDEAKRLAAQSGYTGQPISVMSGGGSSDLAAQALVPMLAEAGIVLRVEKLEGAIMTDRLFKGEYELALQENTWLAPTPLDPIGYLASSQNYYSGDDTTAAEEAVDMLYHAETDADLRAASRHYEESAFSRASIIPLVDIEQVFAVQPSIAGFEPPVGLAFSVASLSRTNG